uniref:N-acetyltransferase domain-containing protein n=1 Tax=Macrostomum lignano TaxID=282301 RepID=A0A1I8JJ03_9PLAT
METQIQIRRGTADDIEAVAAQELELANSHNGMQLYCRIECDEHHRMLLAGLLKLLVAADCQSGRVVGFLLYTPSYMHSQPEPGFYVQSLFVELDYRRHRLYSRCSAVEHRLMMLAGLLRLLVAVAMATGRIVGFVLYTVSHVSQQDLPGLYVQSLFVDGAYRRHRVGQSLLATLGRLAASSGFGHLKLLVQRSNAPAVNCYRRLGFEFLSDTENIGFFELWPAKFVNSMLRAGRRPLPAGLSLELRDCDGRLSGGLEAGRRFALTCAACDCRLQGTAALTYC